MRYFIKTTFCAALVILASSSLFAQNRCYDYRERTSEGKTHILYTAGGNWHDHLEIASVLRRFLEVDHGYYITYTEDYDVFTRSMNEYDIIILNGMPGTMTEAQLSGLEMAVKEGKPVLGLHSATSALGQDTEEKRIRYRSIIGAHFKKHPPIQTFSVKVLDQNHPIIKEIDDFNIFDEMYFYDVFLNDSQVLIEAENEGVSTPIAWVRKYGKGKVFYTSLGHECRAVTNSHYQQLILNALVWLKGE